VFSLLGIVLTFLTLITGSLWGIPMWGTFWVWDARLTSVLVLFFLFLFDIFLVRNIPDETFAPAAAVLSLLGLLNIPIIKYSVVWWNTLHQPASITLLQNTLHILMLFPLFFVFCFLLLFIFIFFIYVLRFLILENKINFLQQKYS
jgi:heme exporter protein C